MNAEPAPVETPMSADDFRLVPAAIDFNTFKTQMVVAALAGVVALVGIALPTIGTHPWGFVFAALATILFGQVISQITALWGNRLGAVPAMWGAIWFAVNPMVINSISMVHQGSGLPDSLMCCCAIAAVFFVLRAKALKERRYYGYAVLVAVISGWCMSSAVSHDLNWFIVLPGMVLTLLVVFPCMYAGGKEFGKANAVVGSAIVTALIWKSLAG